MAGLDRESGEIEAMCGGGARRRGEVEVAEGGRELYVWTPTHHQKQNTCVS